VRGRLVLLLLLVVLVAALIVGVGRARAADSSWSSERIGRTAGETPADREGPAE
jgi:hypothetical protein